MLVVTHASTFLSGSMAAINVGIEVGKTRVCRNVFSA